MSRRCKCFRVTNNTFIEICLSVSDRDQNRNKIHGALCPKHLLKTAFLETFMLCVDFGPSSQKERKTVRMLHTSLTFFSDIC